jgi:hypothetical protein
MMGEGGGGVAGSQSMSTAVDTSPNKLWRSYLIFNLWFDLRGIFSVRQCLCPCRTGQQEMRKRRVGSRDPGAQTENCSSPILPGNSTRCARNFIRGKLCILIFFVKHFIHHCFLCRPSDSHCAGIKPRTDALLVLTVRRCNLINHFHIEGKLPVILEKWKLGEILNEKNLNYTKKFIFVYLSSAPNS